MVTINDLLKKLKNYSFDEISLIKKAYDYANYMHGNQMRQSGEPYITHPLNVAYILSEIHADSDTICAALLHDVLEDTNATKEEIEILFNKDIANLVDGVTKIAKMNFSSKKEQNLANTRKIITSLKTDVRIIIIKLADRLHNMRTLEFKSEFKQKENAQETMELYVPFAYFLGAYKIKNELEDLALKYLYPNKYNQLKEKLDNIKEENKKCFQEMLMNVNDLLEDENIINNIETRTKNIYGVYKQLEEGKKLEDIHDLLALKIMVNNVNNCYHTLGLIHSIYKPIHYRFKDYISSPKTNMYQSLHTTVFGPDEKLVQTQIRTFNMDKIASYGLTAYWDINKNDARIKMQKDLTNNFQFYKYLEEIDEKFDDDEEFNINVKNNLFGNKIYTYTSNGNVVELPKGSTLIDFVNKTNPNTEISNLDILVNNKNTENNYELKTKDRVLVYSK